MLLWCALALGAATQIAAPAPPDKTVRVTLQRTICFGECPDYTVTIDGDGTVTYEGRRDVRVRGRRTAHIEPSRVAALLEEFEAIRFFDLEAEYIFIRNPDGTTTHVTDLPTTFVTLKLGNKAKKVEDYVGAPKELRQLERHIDEAAGTQRWVRIDEPTVRQMARDGWRAKGDEGKELLRRALLFDDVGAIRALVDAGADVEWRYFSTNTPPLMMVRSAAAARALIAAGANVRARSANGDTALAHSIYMEPELTRVLLQAGAPPDDPVEGATALVLAACNGNAEAVDALLKAGANPAVRNARDRTARGCAAANVDRKDPPSILESDYKLPFEKDYRRVLALLDDALARRREDPLAVR